MKQLLFLLCFIAFSVVHAQEKEYAAILATKNDTSKIRTLNEFATGKLTSDLKMAETAFNEIIRLSQLLHYDDGLGQGWYGLGRAAFGTGDLAKAIECFKKAIPFFEKSRNNELVARSYRNLGIVYNVTGKTDSSINSFLKTIQLLEGSSHKWIVASTYTAIGGLYHNLYNYSTALNYHKKALQAARESKDEITIIEALHHAAATYYEVGKYAIVEAYLQEALALSNQLKDPVYIGQSYMWLTRSKLKVNQPDSAIYFGKLATRQGLSIGNYGNYLLAAMHLSDAYDMKNRQQERLKVLEGIIRKAGHVEVEVLNHEFFKRMADVYFKLGAYKQAYLYQQKYMTYKDSLVNEKNTKTVAEIDAKYQSAEKEKQLSAKQLQIAQKDLQLQRSKNYILMAVAGLLVATSIAVGLFLHHKNKRKTYAADLLALQKQKEVKMLEAAMQGEEKERRRIAKDLHDGVAGMVSAVKMHLGALAVKKEVQVHAGELVHAMTLLDQVHEEVRKTSHNLMPEFLSKYGLDEALRRYCVNISNSELVVSYASVGSVGPYKDSFELSVYRIVQELLGNVIKHARASEVQVQVSAHNELLMIEVEDNGVGFSGANFSNGVGLHSLQSRVLALNGKISFVSEQNGLTVFLEFDTSSFKKDAFRIEK